jgi:hypothetical protein
MRQTTPGSQASVEGFDRETVREWALDRLEEMRLSNEQGRTKLGDARRLAWAGVKLCNSLLYRWFNLCEVGAEDLFYAFRMRRFFAGMDLDPATSPQETDTFHSHRVLEEDDYLRPANSPELPGSQSRSAISWRTPWLYLIFLLLIWLLLF